MLRRCSGDARTPIGHRSIGRPSAVRFGATSRKAAHAATGPRNGSGCQKLPAAAEESTDGRLAPRGKLAGRSGGSTCRRKQAMSYVINTPMCSRLSRFGVVSRSPTSWDFRGRGARGVPRRDPPRRAVPAGPTFVERNAGGPTSQNHVAGLGCPCLRASFRNDTRSNTEDRPLALPAPRSNNTELSLSFPSDFPEPNSAEDTALSRRQKARRAVEQVRPRFASKATCSCNTQLIRLLGNENACPHICGSSPQHACEELHASRGQLHIAVTLRDSPQFGSYLPMITCSTETRHSFWGTGGKAHNRKGRETEVSGCAHNEPGWGSCP